ncbi:MAG: 16S rRNA (uracil1498-N3)-methyltransferase [Hyphomicrobiaceae bacterium]
MNLLLLEEHELVGNRARVDGRRRDHLADVLRVDGGDAVRVGVMGGACGTARVVNINDKDAELEVTLDQSPPAPLPCTLILSLQRPHTLGKVLQAATAMGVKRLFLLGGARVEKSYWQSRIMAEAELRRHLVLGLEQARDTILPVIEQRKLFRPFVEDELPLLLKDAVGLVAHPGTGQACPSAVEGPVVLAIGPEGGYTDFELDLMGTAGLRSVALGVRPLRTEHAVPALLGRIF